MNTPNTAQPFTLPPLPPRPSDTPPAQGLAQWEAQQRIYWQAVAVHSAAASAAAQVETLRAQAAALGKKTPHEVILACIQAVPPTIKPSEAAWAKDVVALGLALHKEMPQ